MLKCMVNRNNHEYDAVDLCPKGLLSTLAVLGGLRSILYLMVPFILEQTPDRASHKKQMVINLPDIRLFAENGEKRPFSFMT